MDSVEARFRAVIELRASMIAMQRQLLIREHPEESREQIDRRLSEWVLFQTDPRVRDPGPS